MENRATNTAMAATMPPVRLTYWLWIMPAPPGSGALFERRTEPYVVAGPVTRIVRTDPFVA